VRTLTFINPLIRTRNENQSERGSDVKKQDAPIDKITLPWNALLNEHMNK
jgi:hypothetical protein